MGGRGLRMKRLLAIAVLALLTTDAQATTAVDLKWNPSPAPDLKNYSAYRAMSDDRTTPSLETFALIGTVTCTTFMDLDVPASNLFYSVTARDTSGNESPKCEPILVDEKAPQGIGGLRAATIITTTTSTSVSVTTTEVE